MPPNFQLKDVYNIIGVVVSVTVISIVIFYCLMVLWPQANPHDVVKIAVKNGSTLSDIASTLKSESVIDHVSPFILATRMMGYERSIKSGVFSLKNAKTNYSIIHQLVIGNPIVKRVTIPEGLTVESTAIIFEETVGINSKEFIRLCRDDHFINSMGINVESLEGYLFPDTYYFQENEEPEVIIQKMVSECLAFFDDSLSVLASQFEFTDFEVLTLASIIEGEAIYDSERPLISAVYHNRLRKHMKLQADPTIQYIIEDGPRRLLNKDLKIESPYNTYLYYGLPPGPINNPGEESILAAVNPSDVEYLYFVANGDGRHTFSRTKREHISAKRKFQEVRRQVNRRK